MNSYQQLPVPFDRVDQSTFNGNLPNQNDAVPQVNLSQWLNQNQQIALYAIGLLRSIAQSSSTKSHLHAFCYNLLSQNRFQNNIYQQFSQMVIDLTEFLIVVKGYSVNDAMQKAATRVYEAYMGRVFNSYPALQDQQITPNSMWAGLQTAAQIFQSITNDIQQYRSGAYQSGMPGGSYGGNLPPVSYQPQSSFAHAQVSGNASNHYQAQSSFQHQADTSNTVASSFYDAPVSQPALQPKEEISSDYFGAPIKTETNNMQQQLPNQLQPQGLDPQWAAHGTDLPIPVDVDSCVVDPTYFQPNGFKLNIERPYDVVYNPGGIEIRPASLVDWTVTFGDDAPYLMLVNPDQYCLFLVKFPNGVVKEKFVEWTNTMEYLRHELDAEMRRKAYRPKGIVVSSAVPISTIGGNASPAEEVVSAVEDGHLKRSNLPPVVLSNLYQGSNDLEVEMVIQEELENMFNVKFSKDVPMPTVEYRSQMTSPIQISTEAIESLERLIKTNDLIQVANGIRQLVLEGDMSIRTMRVLNERLTKAVNSVLKDAMSLTIQIEDFCEDYPKLEDYITEKRGENMCKVLQGAAEAVLKRTMQFAELQDAEHPENKQYSLVDYFLNHQVGWTLDDLATLNIKSGRAVMVSATAHPVIIETLKGMINRANEATSVFVGTLRLITSDGYYLEVVKGRLVQGATLLKLAK